MSWRAREAVLSMLWALQSNPLANVMLLLPARCARSIE
jgi:hypothetical protein